MRESQKRAIKTYNEKHKTRQKTIIFRTDNEEDKALFDYANSINFSQFVKNCLEASISQKEKVNKIKEK